MAVSKKHSPSSEADNSPHLLNLKTDYHVHYNLPRILVLRQTNRNHSFPAYFCEIEFNIILALPAGFFHSRFPNENTTHFYSLPSVLHAPAHLTFLDFID
jgi:hypothetical protein